MWCTGKPDQVDAIRQRESHDIAYQNATTTDRAKPMNTARWVMGGAWCIRFLSQRLFKVSDNIIRIFEADGHTDTIAATLMDDERADVSQADPWFA